MAFQEIKDNLNEIKEHSEQYLNTSIDYVRLWGFKITAKTAIIFMTIFVVGVFLLLSLLFLSLYAAFAIGESVGSASLGFLYVGLFYLLISILVFTCRKQLVDRPLIKKLSEAIFND
ncbi:MULTISPECIES: hypothetical protein [unclassified Myroides]|uniref:hypothetical protein n=1 Tax=unclassified Myroides TaxID=2642485 RepID=UPI0015FA5CF8|nr:MULTISPECIES: hypothetical protein [unclassified Myroides]MBB1149275.1 hypothetical protein [Myroides sp. NP-2]MDM1406894.1 hypothetical protein [Myroides sp. DF42-4-2]